jgi:uncharacterized SAM-binding protein YcdF (DUF218 family)
MFLSSAGPPHKADAVVVLAGDWSGKRILEGAELVKEGYAPRVFVSGPGPRYGQSECDLAIAFAVREGYPESYFVPFPNRCKSTRDEARTIVPELRRRGVKSYILVTSDYHTGRSLRLFRAQSPDLQVYAVGSPDADFQLRAWWQDREGRKTVALEWLKTITEVFGI